MFRGVRVTEPDGFHVGRNRGRFLFELVGDRRFDSGFVDAEELRHDPDVDHI